MILRLIAFVLFVLTLATLGGDVWRAYASGDALVLRSAGEWWTATSPSTLESVRGSLPMIDRVLPYPAPAVLGVLGLIFLLPTALFRQRH